MQQAVEQQRMAMDPAMQQQAMQQQAMGGGMAPMGPGGSGDPVAEIMARIEQFGTPNTNTTPKDMTALAQEAAAIFIHLPEMQKRQKLREVEAVNPVMKDLITSEMTKQHKAQNAEFIAQGEQMMQQGGGMPM